jgi:tetratricopeptide (TPR) repeat protein
LALWNNVFRSGGANEAKAKEAWDRAMKYFDGKLYNRALQDLEEAVQLNPALRQEAFELMQVLSGQGDDDTAVSVGIALLKLDPQNHELMNRLGNVLRRMNSFGRASKLYTQALKIEPQFTEAKYNLAACAVAVTTADMELVRQTRAVEPYSRLRRYEFVGARHGFHPLDNENLADDKKGAAAAKKPSRTEAPAPENKPDPEQEARLIETKAMELRGDAERAPGTWEPEYNLGLFFDLVKQHQTATTHYRAAYAIEPSNRYIVNNLAVSLLEQDPAAQEGEDLLLENLHSHKFDRTTILNLAVVNKRAGKAFQTLKWYVYLGDLLARSMGEFELDKVEAHGKELFEKRKYVEAVPIFENLSKEKPQEFWLDKLAVMYLNQKKEDHYIGALKRVLLMNPDRDDARKKISETALGYEKEAHERLQKGSKPIAIQMLLKSVHVEETPERWAEIAQLYEDIGEEIMADNAVRKWKELTAKAQGGHAPAPEGEAPVDPAAAPAAAPSNGGAHPTVVPPRPARPVR